MVLCVMCEGVSCVLNVNQVGVLCCVACAKACVVSCLARVTLKLGGGVVVACRVCVSTLTVLSTQFTRPRQRVTEVYDNIYFT